MVLAACSAVRAVVCVAQNALAQTRFLADHPRMARRHATRATFSVRLLADSAKVLIVELGVSGQTWNDDEIPGGFDCL